MYHGFDFGDVLAVSVRAAWKIEDILPEGARLDFGRPFLPESLARVDATLLLDPQEKMRLNQIRGHEYLSLFGLVEEFILPFVLDHVRTQLDGDDHRVRALLQFAGEEAKHIHLFRRFRALFAQDFPTDCETIGPAEAVADEVMRHDPLAVALFILQIEWMTQSHYLQSVRGDRGIDPLFQSLLRHHWIEEAQHAKLDTLIVESLAEGRNQFSRERAIGEYLEIVDYLDAALAVQAGLNLDALERAIGRALSPSDRATLHAEQHQALRWTYIGSGLGSPDFLGTLGRLSTSARDWIAARIHKFS